MDVCVCPDYRNKTDYPLGVQPAHSAQDEESCLPVGAGAYAALVPWQSPAFETILSLPPRFPHLHICLVYPSLIRECDSILAVSEDQEDLLQPIESSGFRIPVVGCGRSDGVIFEQMHEIFHPLGELDLPGVEYRSGQWRELPAAVFAKPYPKPGG